MLGSFFVSRVVRLPFGRPFAPAILLSALALAGCAGQTGTPQFSWAPATSFASADNPQLAEQDAGFARAAQSAYSSGNGWGPYSGARQATPPPNDVYVYKGGDAVTVR